MNIDKERIKTRKMTDEQLLSYLRKADKMNECTYLHFRNDKKKYPSPATYELRFGTWNKALGLAGVKIRKKHKYTKKELKKFLYQFCAEHKRAPFYDELGGSLNSHNTNKKILPSNRAFDKHFGSWKKALKECGLGKYAVRPFYNKAELKEAMDSFYEKYQRPPNTSELIHSNLPSAHYYRKCFGSWKKALKECGYDEFADNTLSKLGNSFEILVFRILKTLDYNVRRDYVDRLNGFRPDFYFSKDYWGDAKIGSYSLLYENVHTLDYLKIVNKLNIYCLFNNSNIDFSSYKGLNIICVDSLLDCLDKKDYYLRDQVNKIKNKFVRLKREINT